MFHLCNPHAYGRLNMDKARYNEWNVANVEMLFLGEEFSNSQVFRRNTSLFYTRIQSVLLPLSLSGSRLQETNK